MVVESEYQRFLFLLQCFSVRKVNCRDTWHFFLISGYMWNQCVERASETQTQGSQFHDIMLITSLRCDNLVSLVRFLQHTSLPLYHTYQ
jgi:hypothetical protein